MKTIGIPLLGIAALILLLLIVYFAFIKNSNQTQVSSPVTSTEATLSDRLTFPDGYHLASTYAYAFQYTGPYVVYICQSDTDATDYRICTPKVEGAAR